MTTSPAGPRVLAAWIPIFFAGTVFGLGACGQQPQGSIPPLVATTQEALPSTTTAAAITPLPPPPAPASFDVAALSEQVKPLVVNITTTHVDPEGPRGASPFDFFFGPQSRVPRERNQTRTALGTGFVIDAAGFVVTNAHVVDEADEVRVRLADDREFAADVVGRDPKSDLALLKIQGAKDLPAATLGSSEQLRVGEHVLAVGNPFGLGHTVTLGIVSAKARTIGAGPYDDFIQTDASINPGNSGGPLFNWRGEVIGINTAIRAGANGIGFAIPVDALKDVLPQLRDKGRVERGKLGLAFQPLTPELAQALDLEGSKGALVAEVDPSGSAARAGIKAGDVIVAVNGVAIQHAEELPRNVARNPPGAQVKITVARGKQRREVTATLDALLDVEPAAAPPSRGGAPPKSQAEGRLGLQVSDARNGGVRVDEVIAGRMRELEAGDVIVAFNDSPITNVESLRAAMANAKPGATALLKVRRGRLMRFAAITMPR